MLSREQFNKTLKSVVNEFTNELCFTCSVAIDARGTEEGLEFDFIMLTCAALKEHPSFLLILTSEFEFQEELINEYLSQAVYCLYCMDVDGEKVEFVQKALAHLKPRLIRLVTIALALFRHDGELIKNKDAEGISKAIREYHHEYSEQKIKYRPEILKKIFSEASKEIVQQFHGDGSPKQ